MNERKRNRLPGYDYSQDGAYFFTSVVKGWVRCLGEVREGIMHLSAYGEIAQRQWYWLGERYPYVRLHAFVVMPDHVHRILEIDRSMIDPQVRTGRDLSVPNGAGDLPVQNRPGDLPVRNGAGDLSVPSDLALPKIKSLSELKGAYKTTTSKHIRLAGLTEFAWQRSFHDRIIRDQAEFDRISAYINNNPSRWGG